MRGATLVVAQIDRFSRRMALTAALMDSDVKFAVASCPNASRVVLHIQAAYAEHESLEISMRTKAALAELKKRGVKDSGSRSMEDVRAMARIGVRQRSALAKARAMELAPALWKLRAEGQTLAAIATALNWQNVPAPHGGRWYSSSVLALLQMTRQEFATLAEATAARSSRRMNGAIERAAHFAPILRDLKTNGQSLGAVAREMNLRRVPTARGRIWRARTVRNVLALCGEPSATESCACVANEPPAEIAAW